MRYVLALSLIPSVAYAETPSADEDRFFIDKVDDETTEDTTLWQGSITSTSFLHRETAGISDPLTNQGGQAGAESAARFLRLFTDLRTQVDGRHISGGAWDMRFDGRLRYVPNVNGTDGWVSFAPQSGTFGGNEYELRELYVTHGGERTDVTLGRQIVLDLAATKIDGVRLDYASSETWTYLAFAGLYPVRGSRSIDTDYPKGPPVDAMGNLTGSRVLPVAGGAGAAYRTPKAYGALGFVGIAPLARDRVTGGQEQPRVFATSNGYWRPSIDLDLFHYAVVDLAGTAGAGLTNLTLGVNWKPTPRMRINALASSIDTETLNVQAQTQLRDPSQQLPGVVDNELIVSRIASQSARLGLSVGIGQAERFEVSTSAQVRRRPDISLPTGMGSPAVTIKAAQSAELMLQVVDRQSLAGMRLGAMALRSFGVGGANLARTSATILRLSASRSFASEKGEWETDLSYVASKDDDIGQSCNTAMLATCWGASSATTASLSGFGMYRLSKDWLGIASLELASQSLQVSDVMKTVNQPSIIMITGLVRLSYRF
ncbi:MAG TPA: hypothetical protein VL463_19695 [Kofleriaceae bacterium]|nr:hypothetical protein [Kofleriaceae bacterium]